MHRLQAVAILLAVVLTGCGTRIETVSLDESERLVTARVDSAAIARNTSGASSVRVLTVYLPPDYHTSDRDYPVLYFLVTVPPPSPRLTQFQAILDREFTQHPEHAFLVVEFDGYTIQNGPSLWVNSAIHGDWWDYGVHEIPAFMAREFRVLEGRQDTAIAGHSDAGMFALHIGLRNPDMFGVIFSSNPWMFESDEIMRALEDCPGDFISGLLAAVGSDEWDPAMTMISPRGAIEPTESIVQAMDQVIASPAIRSMVNEFTAHDVGQTVIQVMYHEDTLWPYIVTGSTLLTSLLSDAGVPCEFIVIDGVGSFRDYHFEEYLLPFVIDGFDRLRG